MRGAHRIAIAALACLALACGGAPASTEPSPSPSPNAISGRTPDPTGAVATPSPRPATQQVPGELSVVWETTGCTLLETAPTFEHRLVGVGLCQGQSGSRGVAWETENGFEWRRVFETATGVTLRTVSTDGNDGGALIGGWDPAGAPLIWRGDIFDGFEQDEPATMPTEEAAEGVVRAIEWGDGDYLAIGLEGDGETLTPVVWHYEDTGPWIRLEPPPDARELRDVVFDPDSLSYVVAGVTDDYIGAIWRLTNGADWTAPLKMAVGNELQTPTLLDAHTILGTNAVWDEDADGWHFTPLLSGVDAFTGVVLDDGILVFGASSDSNDNPELAVLAAGADRRWRSVEIDPSDKRKLVRSAVLFDDRVIGVGNAVWMGPDEIQAYLE